MRMECFLKEVLAVRTCDKTTRLLDHVAGIWERRTGREITREDAREIVENLCGFFELLGKWDRREQANEEPGNTPEEGPVEQEKGRIL